MGMYVQARAILEDQSIDDVSGVPLMLESCCLAGYRQAGILLLNVYEGKFKGLQPAPEKALEAARKQASLPLEDQLMMEDRAAIIESMFRYAMYLEKGYGCQPAPPEAYKWMRRAAMAGLPKANVELARYLMLGIGRPKAEKLALQLLRHQAILTPQAPNVFFYLGHMCYTGMGMRRPNRTMALRFFERGAAYQDPRAINNLASMYERGMVVSRDTTKALTLYRMAADLGNKDASANLQRLAFKAGAIEEKQSTPASERISRALSRIIRSLPLRKGTKKSWNDQLYHHSTNKAPHRQRFDDTYSPLKKSNKIAFSVSLL